MPPGSHRALAQVRSPKSHARSKPVPSSGSRATPGTARPRALGPLLVRAEPGASSVCVSRSTRNTTASVSRCSRSLLLWEGDSRPPTPGEPTQLLRHGYGALRRGARPLSTPGQCFRTRALGGTPRCSSGASVSRSVEWTRAGVCGSRTAENRPTRAGRASCGLRAGPVSSGRVCAVLRIIPPPPRRTSVAPSAATRDPRKRARGLVVGRALSRGRPCDLGVGSSWA